VDLKAGDKGVGDKGGVVGGGAGDKGREMLLIFSTVTKI